MSALASSPFSGGGRHFVGRVDSFDGGVIRGWVFEPAAPKRRIKVSVLIDGVQTAKEIADKQREDLTRCVIGDGAHAFQIDLSGLVPANRSYVVEVMVDGANARVPGLSRKFGTPPNGKIDGIEESQMVGWAHSRHEAPARIAAFRGSEFLFAWPCERPRGDLIRSGVGNGAHGFNFPAGQLLRSEALDGLRFEIEEAGVTLLAPADLEASAGFVDGSCRIVVDQPCFEDAEEARVALLVSISRLAAGTGAASGVAILGLGFFQRLQNRLSAAEQDVIVDTWLRDWRSENKRAASRAEPLRSGSALIATYRQIASHAREFHVDELVAQIRATLVPQYRNLRHERRLVHTAIASERDLKFLRALTRAFRSEDFVYLPVAAYEQSLIVSRKSTASNLRYLETVRSWGRVNALTDRGHLRLLTRPIPRRPRTMYTLWRSIPYDTNGYAMRSHYLLRGLKDAGADVFGVTRLGYPWDAEKNLPANSLAEVTDGVFYHHLGGAEANRSTMTLEGYVSECAQRFAQIAQASGVDIIHAASNCISALPALRAARMIGVPFVYEIRGLWEVTRASNVVGYELTDHYALFHELETFIANQADLVYVITRQVGEEMKRRGVRGKDMRIAPNGVDVSRFAPLARNKDLASEFGVGESFVFGYIGTFAKYEGLLDLCRAAVELAESGQRDFHVLLTGDGPVFEDVAAYCAEHDTTKRVILTGRVPFEKIPLYYSVIDVAVFPRSPVVITEMVSPLKPFEAFAMHKPVIGSDVAAIAEIVRDGETGWLFRKGDIESLKAVMTRALQNRHLVAEYGMNARKFVEQNHDWPIIAKRLMEGWESLRHKSSKASRA